MYIAQGLFQIIYHRHFVSLRDSCEKKFARNLPKNYELTALSISFALPLRLDL